MQWLASKKLINLFILFFLTIAPAYSQVSSYRLQQADSLFNAKQYTQSLEHYKEILNQNQYSPAMLLKMAFIQEALGKNGEALYSLNLYYLATQDETVLDKMDELAKKENLRGYENTGSTQAFTLYKKYHFYVSVILAVVTFFLFSIAVYMKKKQHRVLAPVIPMLLFIVLLGVHLYAGKPATNGIVVRPNAYLMSGPSAGADVEEIVKAGHRVLIKGDKDVWVEIEWDGKSAFIRRNQLLPVVL